LKTPRNAEKFFPEEKSAQSCSLDKEYNFARRIDLSHTECAETFGFEFIVSKLKTIATVA
jgi:hypothetical protein